MTEPRDGFAQRPQQPQRSEGSVSTHLPPQNLEAEEAVLGAMIMSARAVEAVVDVGLKARDFYRPSHRTIFELIADLSGRDAVDELTLVNELKRLGKLEEVGGQVAVLELVERVPAVANARAYAEEVRDQAILRGLVDTGHKIAQLGYEHADEPRQLVDAAGALISDLAQEREQSDFVQAADMLGEIYDEITDRAENGGKLRGLATGFTDFDDKTGGMHGSQLIIVAARPAMGKTAWALNVAEHVALKERKAVALFSLEMDRNDLVIRVMCSVAKVDSKRIRVGTPNDGDWPLLVDAVGKISAAKGLFAIDDSSALTPMELRSKSRRLDNQLRQSTGEGLGVIIIDYMQLMEAGKKAENRQVEVSYISRQLKSLARELRVPIIALSQLSRGVESRTDKRPMLSDLRESGSIEQDADLVLFLHRPEYYEKDNPALAGLAELIVAKHRNGEIGTIELGFLAKYTKFTNLARRHEANAVAAQGYAPAPGAPEPAGSAPAIM